MVLDYHLKAEMFVIAGTLITRNRFDVRNILLKIVMLAVEALLVKLQRLIVKVLLVRMTRSKLGLSV